MVMSNSSYLLHFVNEYVNFRWEEFLALTAKNQCQFSLVTDESLLKTKPYVIVQVDTENCPKLIKSVEESVLLRGLYELWAQSDSISEIVGLVYKSKHFEEGTYLGVEQSFKINCESFGKKLSATEKVLWIEQLYFLASFKSDVNLKQPKQIYHLLNYYPPYFYEHKTETHHKQEFYFCRQICTSRKSVISKFNLKQRKFIANTTLDPLLSFLTANIAQVDQNHIVYDPFVGSGGLLIAAAQMGAYVIGTDIDFLLLHGRSKPSRIGQKVRDHGESVKGNMAQYGLLHKYLDVIVSDVSRSPLLDNCRFDSIIADPPYGIRESSERVGTKKTEISREPYHVRYPAKTNYLLADLLKDLLTLAANHLTIGGRLVYFLPITTGLLSKCKNSYLPNHPCLEIVNFCEQCLTPKFSRLLTIMRKTRNPLEGDAVQIPNNLINMNHREAYFGNQ